MKFKKNVNINSLIERLKELQQHTSVLQNDFTHITKLFDDSKLGISELNYNLDEELARFKNCFAKIEELIRSL